jgi:hypothetical protein
LETWQAPAFDDFVDAMPGPSIQIKKHFEGDSQIFFGSEDRL